MDNVRGFEEERGVEDDAIGSPSENRIAVSGDERRMHVRAYNHWVSLLDGKPYPSIASLDPASIADFGSHSVLIDFTAGTEDPGIAFLGRALREECGVVGQVSRISDVPGRSLLSRLTDHYLQIIANRAPVGFEAEFVGIRGGTMMYRGILMPFSSDGDEIDYIYGVINWKEMADAATQAALTEQVTDALLATPAPAAPAPVWADGPGAIDTPDEGKSDDGRSLGTRLAAARASAEEVAASEGRSRAALYTALGEAHAFATAAASDPDGYEALRAASGITVQARAPMTAIAKLVFGTATDKARLTEYAAVLAHAARTGVPGDALTTYLNATEGGMKALVAAERAHRGGKATPHPAGTERVDRKPALATVRVPVDATEGYLLLLGRIVGDKIEIVADVTEPAPLNRAIRRAA